MKGIIYKVTNIQNNKCYIGQTIKTLTERKYSHENLSKNNSQLYFHRAIRKYGIQNFKWEILGYCYSEKRLFECEIECISFFKSNNSLYGYNMSLGGFNPRLKGKWNGMYGKKHTKESKEKMSKSFKGKKFIHKKYRHINIDSLIKDYEYLNQKQLSKKYKCSIQFIRRRIKENLNEKERERLNKKHKGHGKNSWKKGKIIPWNKGKTKETHPEIKIISDNMKKYWIEKKRSLSI